MLNEKLYNILQDWASEAGLRKNYDFIIADQRWDKVLKIYTNKPGYLIGKGGCLVEKYTNIVHNAYPCTSAIHFVEILSPVVWVKI